MLVPNGLERSHLWVVIFSWPWPVAVVCRVPMVTFQLRGLKVHVRVLGQHHGVR